jgi:tRNA U34 5-methylaminomethyl-2-thiouridine-forming methyltransferase MnmC
MDEGIIEIVATADGSHTLYNKVLEETYHSRHGALAESVHVFIEAGLKHVHKRGDLRILEVGFGTGLNAMLTLQEQMKIGGSIHYVGIDTYEVPGDIIEQLNYTSLFSKEAQPYFNSMHQAPWGCATEIREGFTLEKQLKALAEYQSGPVFDLVYYDAFAPKKQPEMWQPSMVFQAIKAMKPGGILVTYCAMGQFRRDLETLGMTVERLQGPPGKREMVRAIKSMLIA